MSKRLTDEEEIKLDEFLDLSQAVFSSLYSRERDSSVAIARQELEYQVEFGDKTAEQGIETLKKKEEVIDLIENIKTAQAELMKRRVEESEDKRIVTIEHNTSTREAIKIGVIAGALTTAVLCVPLYFANK